MPSFLYQDAENKARQCASSKFTFALMRTIIGDTLSQLGMAAFKFIAVPRNEHCATVTANPLHAIDFKKSSFLTSAHYD